MWEIFGYQESRVPHEIQNVPEHASIAVNEIVLLQRVQYNRYWAIEQLRQFGIGIFGQCLQWTCVYRATHIDVNGSRVTTGRGHTWYAGDGLMIGMHVGGCTGGWARSAARTAVDARADSARRQTQRCYGWTGRRCRCGWTRIWDRWWNCGWSAINEIDLFLAETIPLEWSSCALSYLIFISLRA